MDAAVFERRYRPLIATTQLECFDAVRSNCAWCTAAGQYILAMTNKEVINDLTGPQIPG